jgi:enediyne polyketide synthase
MDPLPQARNGHGQNLATPDRIALAPDSTPANSNEALSILEQVRESVAKRAELPVTAIAPESSLLGDLHLNSISVGQLVAEVAVQLHLPPIIGLTDFAGATVGKVAAILEDLCRRHEGGSAPEPIAIVPGVDSWVRPLLVEWVETPSPTESNGARHGLLSPGAGQGWEIITSPGHPLAASLRTGLAILAGLGVVVCLPPEANEVALDLLLRGARRAMEMGPAARFVLVQHGWGGAGFARSLFLESSGLTVSVIDLPFEHPLAVQWVVREASRVGGFCEARYDTQGVRREPRLRAEKLSPDIPGEFPLGPRDVLLVTGGGKGIASECAFSLARRSGARLVLMGRSQPESDPELASNLERFAGAGIAMHYVSADVMDAAAVRSALARAEKEWGPITAFLHGAGANVPKLIGSLDLAGFRHTLAPKIQGARNVLAVVGEQLRVFVTFGSIIGRAGLAGEADYALANEWLTCLTTDYAAAHPGVRCLAAEWSVWSGLGMGARLGRIESLRQQGITPITPEQGTALLEQVLSCHQSPQVLVLAGRFGEMPTLRWAQPELPLARFLENPRVYYPGVELIAESTLSAGSDPYIEEHIYQGERLFPAVMGLEAMAQVAMALQGSLEPPSFEEVKFNRPVIVPRAGKLVIRVAALAKAPGEVDVVLRTGDTGFQVDHFRATCRFDVQPLSSTEPEDLPAFDLQACAEIRVPLAIDSDLYDDLLFHSGRFRRVKNYRVLRARECVVQLEPDTQSTWFGHYLPSKCVLGDAGVRDAAIHAIQACLPHARLLPAGVDRIVIGRLPCLDERLRAAGRKPVLLLHARERRRDGDSLYFDLELLAEEGTLLERWEGLCLRVIEKLERTKPWPLALLGPGVERRVEELVPGSRVAVIIGQDISSDDAIRQASGGCGAIRRRLDGKPGMEGTKGVSVAHAGSLTLAIAALAPVGCDLEPVTGRTLAAWQVLLGPERIALAQQLAREMGEPFDHAATRTWTAIECLKKAGIPVESPLVLGPIHPDRWVMLRSGGVLIATFVAQVRDVQGELALAVLASERT